MWIGIEESYLSILKDLMTRIYKIFWTSLHVSKYLAVGEGEGSFDEILQFVMFNPSDLNNNYFDCFPLENIVTDEVGSSTDNKSDTKKHEDKKIETPSRRGRPCSKPLTWRILKERRNVSICLSQYL
jgi:hypothetical protein